MNIHSSSYNPNGIRQWITVGGKDIEVDDLSVYFEGVDVSRIDNPQEWAEATAETTMDVINGNRGDDEPEMTAEECEDMERTLMLYIKYHQQAQ